MITQIVTTLCALLPVWVVAAALSMVAIAIVLIIVKIVSFVLDAIPFL